MTYPWMPITSCGDVTSEQLERERQRAEQVIENSELDADEALVDHGDPVDAILGAVDEHAVSLLVVGSNNKGWFERLLSGSVSHSLAFDATCPVLVVH